LPIAQHAARLAERNARHPWWALSIALLLSLLSLWATARLPVYTSRQALLPQDTAVAERFNSFLKKFGAASDLIVVLEGAPRGELEAYATLLAARLRAEPEIGQANERLDTHFFLEHADLLLPPERLEQFGAAMEKMAGLDLPGDAAGLEAALDRALAWTKAPPPMGAVDLGSAEEGLETLVFALEEWERWLSAETAPAGLDWERLLARHGADSLAKGYFASRDGRMLFLFVQAKTASEEFEAVAPFVGKVRQVAERLAAEAKAQGRVPPKVGLTGLPAVECEEYLDIQEDIVLVVSSAAGLIAVLILAVVRSFRWALAIFVPMGLGALWSLGLAWLSVGHLTIVTSGFLAILFGLGADYGIFTSSSIAEARRAGRPLLEAIGAGIGSSFGAVFTAGGASVLIFGALATVDFPGFAELGRVAAGGVLLILVSTWMVQPALYALLPPKLRDAPAGKPARPGAGKRRGALPLPVAAGVVALAALSAGYGALRGFAIPFDYDALSLLPKDSEAAHYQRRMVAESDYQAEVVIFTAKDMAEARRIAEAAGQIKTIAKVQSLASLFPPDAEERLREARAIGEAAARADYAGKVAGLRRDGLPEPAFERLRALLPAALDLIDGYQEQAFAAGHTGLVDALERARGRIAAIQSSFDRDAGRGRERSERFVRALLDAAGEGLGVLAAWRSAEPLAPAGIPRSLRDRFFAGDGTIAVYAFPAENVYDPANLERLVREVYSVSPEATGFPVTHQEFSKIVVDSFFHGTALALAVCLSWLVLAVRDARGIVLAALPLLIGGGWMLGIMAWAGIKYNYANIIALPLVIALAVDYGVWFSHRWLELKDRSPMEISVIAGKVIALAAGTELAGLGAITMASYRGVSTLGVDITIGLLCCLPATLLVAPAIGQLLDRRRLASNRGERSAAVADDRAPGRPRTSEDQE
jgi:predicted RND superfamily exporter protein